MTIFFITNNISYKTICVDEKMEISICKFGLSMYLNKSNQTIDYIKKYLLVYNLNMIQDL